MDSKPCQNDFNCHNLNSSMVFWGEGLMLGAGNLLRNTFVVSKHGNSI